MTKLTPTQLTVLSSAHDRDDNLATRPANLRAAAATKLVVSLCEKGFVKEIRAKADAPVWREDEDGRFALKVLKAGRLAAEAQAEADAPAEPTIVSGTPEAADTQPVADDVSGPAAPAASKKTRSSASGVSAPAPTAVPTPAVALTAPAAPGFKRDRVIALLQRPEGAAMAELIAATGWLPHTTRAALSGLRKNGMALQRFRDEELTTRYRIAEGSVAPGESSSDRTAA